MGRKSRFSQSIDTQFPKFCENNDFQQTNIEFCSNLDPPLNHLHQHTSQNIQFPQSYVIPSTFRPPQPPSPPPPPPPPPSFSNLNLPSKLITVTDIDDYAYDPFEDTDDLAMSAYKKNLQQLPLNNIVKMRVQNVNDHHSFETSSDMELCSSFSPPPQSRKKSRFSVIETGESKKRLVECNNMTFEKDKREFKVEQINSITQENYDNYDQDVEFENYINEDFSEIPDIYRNTPNDNHMASRGLVTSTTDHIDNNSYSKKERFTPNPSQRQCLESNGKPVVDITDSSKIVVSAANNYSSSLPKTTTKPVVMSEADKILWKSIWVVIKKYLKPYLKNGNIRNTDDFHHLSKKFAQKIFEKESPRGLAKASASTAGKIKKYIVDYFVRFPYYQHSSKA